MSNEDDFCPGNQYSPGTPGGQCWGVGHYLCSGCAWYRADFKANGQDYIDFMHNMQSGGLRVDEINILQV